MMVIRELSIARCASLLVFTETVKVAFLPGFMGFIFRGAMAIAGSGVDMLRTVKGDLPALVIENESFITGFSWVILPKSNMSVLNLGTGALASCSGDREEKSSSTIITVVKGTRCEDSGSGWSQRVSVVNPQLDVWSEYAVSDITPCSPAGMVSGFITVWM